MSWSCDICFEIFTASLNEHNVDHIICTPCGHVYHNNCINNWFRNSYSCPNCRKYCNQNDIKRIFFSTNEETEIKLKNHANTAELDDEINFLKSVNQSLQDQYDLMVVSNKRLSKYEEEYEIISVVNVELEKEVADFKENITILEEDMELTISENVALIKKIEELKLKIAMVSEELEKKEAHLKELIKILQEDIKLKNAENIALINKLEEAELKFPNHEIINASMIQFHKIDSEKFITEINDKINTIKILTDCKTANEMRINELQLEIAHFRSSKVQNNLNGNDEVEKNCFNEAKYFRSQMKRIS